MGFGYEGRKTTTTSTMLYADLFKSNRGGGGGGVGEDQNLSEKSTEEWSSSYGSSNLESDEDDDFIGELSRQMAECMLQEENEENQEQIISHPVVWDDPNSCLQLKNQLPVSQPVRRGELTQQQQHKNYGRYTLQPNYCRRNGSGMRAVFLGGPGSTNVVSSGTGVFLPRLPNDSLDLKKKSGLSTVLIPTRVLDALELHYNRLSDSAARPPHHASPRDEWRKSKWQGNRHPNFQQIADDEETQILPQEWTY